MKSKEERAKILSKLVGYGDSSVSKNCANYVLELDCSTEIAIDNDGSIVDTDDCMALAESCFHYHNNAITVGSLVDERLSYLNNKYKGGK